MQSKHIGNNKYNDIPLLGTESPKQKGNIG